MVKTFTSNNEYIDFLTSLSIENGEVFCTNFLPSSFFPKHSIETFFKHKDRLPDYKKAVSRLWEYGKYVYKAIAKGRASLCVEINSLHTFCESGLVHNAIPSFEVGFPVRVAVLKKLSAACKGDTIFFVTGPIPFVFRLHPPNGILIDVMVNQNEQLIQGIWIEDNNVYSSFQKELNRLIENAPIDGKTPLLNSKFNDAIKQLESGYSYSWIRHE